MEVYSAEGMWWRPEASQHRVPGTLTSDEDGVLGLPRSDGQGWWLGQATCLTTSSSVAVSNSSGVR
jgi:hypothetical protein